MIMKTVGAALVITGCGSVGFYIAYSHRYELKCAQKLLTALEFLSCELNCKLLPLPDLCRKTADAASGVTRNIFHDFAVEMERQISPSADKCMQIVLDKTPHIPLSVRNAYMRLGQSLGNFYVEDQLKGIESVCNELKEQIHMLTTNQEVRLRSYRTLGICAGAAIAILFL